MDDTLLPWAVRCPGFSGEPKQTKQMKAFIYWLLDKLLGTDRTCDIYLYIDKVQEMMDLEQHYACICSDPMNGCPGDFAEDGDRRMTRLQYEFDSYTFDIPKWVMPIIRRILRKHQEKLNKEYASLPWNR